MISNPMIFHITFPHVSLFRPAVHLQQQGRGTGLATRRHPPQKNILNDISILIGDGDHTHDI